MNQGTKDRVIEILVEKVEDLKGEVAAARALWQQAEDDLRKEKKINETLRNQQSNS